VGRDSREVAVAYFKTLLQNLPEESEDITERLE
jgi:hypothetical protein